MVETAKKYKLIGPFKQLLSMDNIPLKGAIRDSQLSIISEGGILFSHEHIEAIDEFQTLLSKAKSLKAEIIELQDHFVCLPGLIDAHTHICFDGSRARDYALRNSGKSYLEIAKQGGGIWDTVTHTRKADAKKLVEGILQRAQSLIESGITTIEVKSGYGLSIEEELKMLRAIQEASQSSIQDLVPTCLAAHILPKDYHGNHQEYLQEISDHLFPLLKKENLCQRIDAFVEEEAFSEKVIYPYFAKAKSMGFDLTVHADQFSTGGSKVAIQHQAMSADHLEASSAKEIEMLAQSNVIATALPGASIGLGCDFTPARKLLDAGASLAIASDWNPGSAPMGDLFIQASILATFEKLSNAEVLAGITFRAAAALGLKDRGILKPRNLADFCLYNTDHFNEICYQQGRLKPSQVWKNGNLVYS